MNLPNREAGVYQSSIDIDKILRTKQSKRIRESLEKSHDKTKVEEIGRENKGESNEVRNETIILAKSIPPETFNLSATIFDDLRATCQYFFFFF